MDKRIIESILTGQRDKLISRLPVTYLPRPEAAAKVDLNAVGIPQVITGVHGVGKTTMAYHLLTKEGINFGYANLGDPRLAAISSFSDIYDVVEVLYKMDGSITHVLLDEMYRIHDWIGHYVDATPHGIKVIATLSGCRHMLDDIADRVNIVHLYPFTFEEICRHKELRTDAVVTHDIAALRALFDEYLRRGGLPGMIGTSRHRRYLDDIIVSSLRNTVIRTSTIANTDEFERLGRHVLNESPLTLSYRHLAEDFNIRSEHTIKKYLQLLKESGLMLGLKKIAFREAQRTVGERLFAIDPAVTHFSPRQLTASDMERSMTTVINRHLLRHLTPQGYVLHYYADRNIECDFGICYDYRMHKAIQVCYDATDERALRRKVSGLVSLSKLTGCTDLLILTDNQSRDIEVQGAIIKLRPAYEWLLKPIQIDPDEPRNIGSVFL